MLIIIIISILRGRLLILLIDPWRVAIKHIAATMYHPILFFEFARECYRYRRTLPIIIKFLLQLLSTKMMIYLIIYSRYVLCYVNYDDPSSRLQYIVYIICHQYIDMQFELSSAS